MLSSLGGTSENNLNTGRSVYSSSSKIIVQVHTLGCLLLSTWITVPQKDLVSKFFLGFNEQ